MATKRRKRKPASRVKVTPDSIETPTTLDDALRELIRARRLLREEQGWMARRTARRRFVARITALRRALDSTYPKLEKPKMERKPGTRRDAKAIASATGRAITFDDE